MSDLPLPIVKSVTFTVLMVNPRPAFCCQCRTEVYCERGYSVQLSFPSLTIVFCRKCFSALADMDIAGQTPAPGQGGQ